MREPLPPLDDCGFVRVPSDDGAELWMTCESCGKSDHFWLDDAVHCRCGARYDFAVRPDGSQVPSAQLEWVPFRRGPMALGSWEWAPGRVALLVGIVLVMIGGLLVWLW